MGAPLALALAAALAAPPVAPRPPVRIQADDIDYRLKDGVTVATGSPFVTMTREDAVLTCKRLLVENDAKGKIRKATCEGDVKLTRGSRVVTCETAVYEDDGARIVCRGNPTMRDGQSQIQGEVLTYELEENRVRLTRGKGTLFEQPEPGEKK